MRAVLYRALRVVLLVTMLGALGTLAGASGAAAAGSGTPPVPTSTITPTTDPNTVTYCVDNYAFNSTVSVVNNANGATATIHTDAGGHGCTPMPVKTSCTNSVDNTIVASGTDQAGAAASSQATYSAPPNSAACPSTSPTPSASPTCDSAHAHLSITVTPQGGTIRGTACGFLVGESVDAFAHSQPVYLGTTTARADGTVSAKFTLPMSVKPGNHTWIYVGRTSGHRATASFRVTKVVTGNGGGVLPGGGTGSGNGGGSGLAFTGADIAAMVLAALVLLAIGTLIVVSVRRRRAAPVA